MSQIDTGLGWLAESDWLLQADNYELAKIGNYTGLCGPFNVGTTQAQVWQLGQTIATSPDQYGDIITKFTSYNTNGDVYVAASSSFGYWFISLSPNTSVYGIRFRAGGRVYADLGQAALNQTYDRADGTRFYYRQWSANWGTLDSAIPVFSSVAAACNAFVFSGATFTKTNAGFSVACVVKWKTQNGTALVSPILISSDTDYTEMSSSETGLSLAKLNQLLSGVRFYMAFWDMPDTDLVISSTLPQLDLTSQGNISLDQLFMIIISTTNAHVTIVNSPDPYETEGGGSGEEGGDGEETEDDGMGITHHAIPAAINTGFCRIYCPNEQQLRDLSNFLWSAQFDITAVKKLFANPMDSVLGLSAVPINLSGASMRLYLGGVDTEMSFPMVSYQSYQVPMGYITVKERWGSYLDYDPYTKFSIYLPFIGFKDLSADDIMGKQLILDYDIDILSGACTARLQAGRNTLYQWSGQCAIQLPVTASNWNQVFQSATSAALSAGLAVATGTAGPVLAGALAAEGVQAIMGKPRIERGGTASGAAGWMGGLTPYLVRVTPEAIIPSEQNKFIGYPAFSSISLGALTGYNEISSIHLEGIPATGAELDELEAILKGGVIF